MTYDNLRPNSALGATAYDGSGEHEHVAKIAPEPVDDEKVVEARSRLLGEGQERGWSEDDDEVRQSS